MLKYLAFYITCLFTCCSSYHLHFTNWFYTFNLKYYASRSAIDHPRSVPGQSKHVITCSCKPRETSDSSLTMTIADSNTWPSAWLYEDLKHADFIAS